MSGSRPEVIAGSRPEVIAGSRPEVIAGSRPEVIAVIGPTATGKTALGIAIAQAVGGEVVNADSMQLYEGMDIGTAKASAAERDGVPHHLLDVWPLGKTAAVAGYQVLARERIADIRSRGAVPVFVGGSGLYLRAALDPLEFPGESPEVRARLEADLAGIGAPALHERLRAVDPDSAAGILPSNGRRIVRALEVLEVTGEPYRATLPSYESLYDVAYVGLDRADLDDRVNQRVHAMMASGFVEEVRGLLPKGLREAPTAAKALGYAQLLAVLDDAGELVGDLEAAVEHTIARTRRFVRRQRSWFRRDPRIVWLDAASPELVERALAEARAT
ncbi:MAG: tRNA delta(2)-isopentenylpyrophosphate transferase [Jatrophihabitantaceae bacterium]|nr:tRNA delta(2)-isopentenylpyrophosphate transferase [Jatrophihabitantaceae bacterium]